MHAEDAEIDLCVVINVYVSVCVYKLYVSMYEIACMYVCI